MCPLLCSFVDCCTEIKPVSVHAFMPVLGLKQAVLQLSKPVSLLLEYACSSFNLEA